MRQTEFLFMGEGEELRQYVGCTVHTERTEVTYREVYDPFDIEPHNEPVRNKVVEVGVVELIPVITIKGKRRFMCEFEHITVTARL